jgi:hypothetical protein
MPSSDEFRDEVMRAILDRAARNNSFRRALLTDPKPAIREQFGVAIPDEFRIRFVERDNDVDALVVLPDMIGEEELSERDLDTVAGGVQTDYQWIGP